MLMVWGMGANAILSCGSGSESVPSTKIWQHHLTLCIRFCQIWSVVFLDCLQVYTKKKKNKTKKTTIFISILKFQDALGHLGLNLTL